MAASRALSEHKQRQRLNFLERVKQEIYHQGPKCPTHGFSMVRTLPGDRYTFRCQADNCPFVSYRPPDQLETNRYSHLYKEV